MIGPGLLIALMALIASGCATTATPGGDAVAHIEPGQRPALDTDEGGLWMVMDDVEQRLATSGRTVTDPALNARVGAVICRLVPAHCAQIRFYIVRNPDFNASMSPNGFMQIWTGLLLRTANEDQLAFVLGHELVHYLERHTLSRWRDLRSKADTLAVLNVATAAFGVGYVGTLAELAAYASILAFSRDQERAADQGGFDLLVDAGYDANEAGRIWRALIEEREASADPGTISFFTTHPSSQERAQSLEALAAGLRAPGEPSSAVRSSPYSSLVAPYRAEWFRDELRSRDFARHQVVLDRLATIGEPGGEIAFLQGELYRLRNGEGDVARAIEAYRKAAASGEGPPEAWLQMGLMLRRTERSSAAREAFRAYLERKPDAPDRKMVEAYLDELQ